MNYSSIKHTLSLLTTLLSLNISAQTVVTVGESLSTVLCDFETIQEAIDSGAQEVRVLNNQEFQENLIIDRQIDIKGGYQNCLSASLDQPDGSNTQIDASQLLGAPAIFINSTDNPAIRLYRLSLKNAVDTSIVDGGRGLHIGDSNGLIELFDVSIFNNAAENGAGIYAANPPGSLRIFLNNSAVFGNTATNRGGGVFCGNQNTFVTIQNDTGVFENTAFDGGGIAAINGCSVTISSGADVRQGNFLSGVISNLATNDGGGVFADLAALVYFQGNRYGAFALFGNNTLPATLASNSALGHGGGLALIRGSQAELLDTIVWSNSSSSQTNSRGGAFYLDETASLYMGQSPNNTCWNNQNCSILANNKSQFGGALYQQNNTSAVIENTYIFGNQADFGLVVYSRENDIPDSYTELTGNMIYQNGQDGSGSHDDKFLFRGFEDVYINLKHNSIVNNDIDDSTAILGASTGAEFTLSNSIIENPNIDVYQASGVNNSLTAVCVLANETASFSGTNIREADPGFVDPANNDYHLAENSEAEDMCASLNGINTDIDKENRGFDAPIVNINGPFDAGADESYASDVIFKSNFE